MDPAGSPPRDRTPMLATYALYAWGLAVAFAGIALVPALAQDAGALGAANDRGSAVRALIVDLAVTVALILVAVRILQAARTSGRSGFATAATADAVARIAQVAALLVALLGLRTLVDRSAVGLVAIAAGILGLLAAGTWLSKAPGRAARAGLWALLATVLYLVFTLVPTGAARSGFATDVLVPNAWALVVGAAALLAAGATAGTRGRSLGPTLLCAAALVAGLFAATAALGFIADRSWSHLGDLPLEQGTRLGLLLVACLLAIAAGVLAFGAAVLGVSRHAPVFVGAIGTGFGQVAPGHCVACASQLPMGAHYCPQCGAIVRPAA